jgi:hypothetical protein
LLLCIVGEIGDAAQKKEYMFAVDISDYYSLFSFLIAIEFFS